MKKYKIKFNDKIYEVEVEELPLDYKIENKDTAKNEVKKVNNAPKANNASGSAVVKAPMPGKILDIKVSEGSEVKKGQVLVILEAMKLENEIVSPVDGVVVSINTEKGSSVELDATLITLQ